MHDPLIGHPIDGYTIRALLGSGGMAQVYRAQDTRLGREVALKLLDAAMLRQAGFNERFLREAQTLASVRHATIVQIYDIGTFQGRPYLVQELLPGPTLDDELTAARAAGTTLLLDQVTTIIQDVASALDHAHARGIIHRDLKPHNVMRNGHGRMVLMDFGIAKQIAGAEKLTQTGMVMGTPQYLAPEQAQGGPLTPAVDIYALGVLLFELLTNQVPFDDPSPLVVAIAHLSTPPPAPRSLRPDLSPAVEAVVLQALAKAPEGRFASAGDLAAALVHALHAAPTDPAGSIHTMATTMTPVVPSTASVHHVRTTVNPALADQAAQARLAAPPPLAHGGPASPPLGVATPPAVAHPPRRRTGRIAAGVALALIAAFLILRPTGGSTADTTPTPAGATAVVGVPTTGPTDVSPTSIQSTATAVADEPTNEDSDEDSDNGNGKDKDKDNGKGKNKN